MCQALCQACYVSNCIKSSYWWSETGFLLFQMRSSLWQNCSMDDFHLWGSLTLSPKGPRSETHDWLFSPLFKLPFPSLCHSSQGWQHHWTKDVLLRAPESPQGNWGLHAQKYSLNLMSRSGNNNHCSSRFSFLQGTLVLWQKLQTRKEGKTLCFCPCPYSM